MTNSKKTKPENRVAPIIYFRINYELVKHPLLLEKKIMDDLRNTKIIINSIKVTQNGNLLVYPGSLEDKKMLNEKKLLFPESQSCDLEISQKKSPINGEGDSCREF
jgi:hypothetical protein